VRKRVHPTALKILSAFNATLPEITKRFASSLVKSNGGYFNERSYQQDEPSTYPGPNSNGSIGYPRPMSQCRNQVNEIYDIAMHKTRETCLKAERGIGIANHIPFLGAPCSTIGSYTRAATANAMVELNDANCVTFAERKVAKGKRTLGMMRGGDNYAEDKTDSKRRRLGSEVGKSLSRHFVLSNNKYFIFYGVMNHAHHTHHTHHSLLHQRSLFCK
jgi:hypothetical protein